MECPFSRYHITDGSAAAIVHFNHSEKLPAEADIRINIGKKYSGQILHYCIIKGKADNNFDPKDTCTRAEVSVILKRLIMNMLR